MSWHEADEGKENKLGLYANSLKMISFRNWEWIYIIYIYRFIYLCISELFQEMHKSFYSYLSGYLGPMDYVTWRLLLALVSPADL